MIYVLGLVLAIPMAFIDPQTFLGSRGFGDWNLVYYAIVLIFGFICFADEQVQLSIIKQRCVSIIVGLVLYVMSRGFGITFKSSPYNLGWFHYVLSSWCLVIGLLGFGLKYLGGSGRFLKYSTEAVLPFYVLHQMVILLMAFWVVQL